MMQRCRPIRKRLPRDTRVSQPTPTVDRSPPAAGTTLLPGLRARAADLGEDLRQDLVDDLAVNIGQPVRSAGMHVSELLVIETQQMQNGGAQVVDVHYSTRLRECLAGLRHTDDLRWSVPHCRWSNMRSAG